MEVQIQTHPHQSRPEISKLPSTRLGAAGVIGVSYTDLSIVRGPQSKLEERVPGLVKVKKHMKIPYGPAVEVDCRLSLCS